MISADDFLKGGNSKPVVRGGKLVSADEFVKQQPAPMPIPTPMPEVKPSIFSKVGSSVMDAGKKVLDMAGKVIERPEGKAAESTLRQFIPTLIENIPLGFGEAIKQIRDDPELASTIKAGDLMRSVGPAVAETGKAYVRGGASYPLTFFGLGAKLVGGDENVSLDIPVLGKVTNLQARVAEEAVKSPESFWGDSAKVALFTGEELLNGLFVASMTAKLVNPRPVSLGKSKALIPAGTLGEVSKPKSFRLYEGVTPEVRPIPKEFVQKMIDDGVKLKRPINPDLPTFYKITTKGDKFYAEIIQMKPPIIGGKIVTSKNPEPIVIYEQEVTEKALINAKATVEKPTVTPEPVVPTVPKPTIQTVMPVSSSNAPTVTNETVQVEGIGQVPIVGTVDSATGRITADEFLKQEAPKKSNKIGLMDDHSSYTPRMNQLIKEAQDKGEMFPFSKMTKEEQAILDSSFRDTLSKIPEKKIDVPTNKINYPVNPEKGVTIYAYIDKGTAKIESIEISKSKQKQGLGTKYVKDIEKWAKDNGATSIEIGAYKKSVGFWEKMGFDLEKEFPKIGGVIQDYKYGKKVIDENNQPIPYTVTKAGKKSLTKVSLPKKAKTNLTLAPTKAKKPEEIEKEAKEVFGSQKDYASTAKYGKGLKPFADKATYEKQPIDKAKLKTLLASNAEFKQDPVLTVDANKNLTFKGKSVNFTMKPEALGLNKDNLKVGDKITVDEKAIKAKGAESQLRVYNNGKVQASIGKFRDGTPITLAQTENIKTIELPEMVQLAKELMGLTPKIKQKVSRAFGGNARGIFIAKDGGDIVLRADLFDPAVNSIDQAAKTLAHEIGHLLDYLPEGTMKRGNLLGRLSTLREFRKDFWAEAGYSRTNNEVTKQLWELSKYWKPIDEVAMEGTSFLAYRKSAKEIYADFISVLFNDPDIVMEKAPTAFNVFFEQLDKKPKVRDSYFELQAMLSGERQTIIDARREGVQKMFKEGDLRSIDYQNAMQLKRKARRANSMETIRFNLIDNNTPMIDRVKKLEKSGIHLNPDDDPRYLLEARNYLTGKIKATLERNVAPILDELNKNDIAWDTLGEVLFYERIIAGDRSAQANPRGITPDAAKELYADVEKQLGNKFAIVEKGAKDFRKWLKDIAEEAYKEGMYTPELYKQMQDNPAYVTFRVIEHIESGVDSKIYKSIGTLKDITNPADASIFKAIATIHAIERNKVLRVSSEMLKTHYPTDIEPAKSIYTGKGHKFIESKDSDNKLIVFKRAGKAEGYYVDPYIAHSLNNETLGQNNAVMRLIQPISYLNRHLFRPLFIGYNPGFQAFNLIRDFKRFWKNMPDMSLLTAFKRYYQAMPVAKARAFGIGEKPSERMKQAEAMVQELEYNQVFSTTYTDYTIGEAKDEQQIELILKSAGLEMGNELVQKTAFKKFLTPFIKILDTIQKVGNYIETLPKVAGVYQMTGGDVSKLTAEQRSYIRKNIGSPDFLTHGYVSPVTNDLFLFSNAIAQGIRSDVQVMVSPKTRSGYWWKTAKLTLLPKILMFMASIGLFGKAIKDLMDGSSEYDKTNYTIIPLGVDDNGKTIYLRMPDDETGRLLGAVTWKTLGMFDPNKQQEFGQQLSDVISLLGGQIPSITPTVSTAQDIFQYISGQNPYDSFRGRNVLSDDLFKANNFETDKAFAGYVFNQLGGGIFYRFASMGATPQKTSDTEELVNLPIISNVVGRFIRVSDYGKSEQLRQIQSNIQQEASRERLSERKLVDKYIEQAIESPEDRIKLERELVKENFGHMPFKKDELEKANNLRKKFRVGLVRGVSGTEIDSLTYAVSNKEKLAILEEVKKRLSDSEFAELRRVVIREKIVSSDVFRQLNEK